MQSPGQRGAVAFRCSEMAFAAGERGWQSDRHLNGAHHGSRSKYRDCRVPWEKKKEGNQGPCNRPALEDYWSQGKQFCIY